MWVAWSWEGFWGLRTKNLNFLTFCVEWISPPNSYVEVWTASAMVPGACGRHLGLGEVMKTVSGLQGDPASLSLCHVQAQAEGLLQAKRRHLPGNQICWHLDLGFPASRTLRIKWPPFKPSGQGVMCYSSLGELTQVGSGVVPAAWNIIAAQ